MAKRIKCDSCAVLVINGVVCHEIGCPKRKKEIQKLVKTSRKY